jgi:hypothetical protein
MKELIESQSKKKSNQTIDKFLQIRVSKGTSKFSITNHMEIILNETRCNKKI